MEKIRLTSRFARQSSYWSSSKTSSQDERIFKKWATLWRSIILSSLSKTLYPYSQYIRTLDLGDLMQLIRDSEYLEERTNDFFQDELAQFKIDKQMGYLDARAKDMANNIGEAITQQTPLLERLTGEGYNEELSRWIPRLPRLTHLKLWDGAWIEGNGNLVRLHCPSFKRLELWDWRNDGADQGLAAFLDDLRPQSLESFQSFSSSNYGPQSFRKLSSHGESLIQLKLHWLTSDMLPKLSLLKGCINLISLSLSGNRANALTDFEKSHKGAFLETAA
ncbi:hypothetical protein MMC22_007079 [Lobaria immixta]|nr:hypothetical protein [Lobaria immixta]